MPPEPAADAVRDRAPAPVAAVRPARVVLPPSELTRWLGIGGLAAVALSLLAMGILHLTPPSDTLDPLSRTISEYALLSDGWIFQAGVLVLAAGSLAILAGMVLRGLVRPRSWSTVFITVWAIGLIGLVVFPKQGFGPDTSIAGRVHWTWTLIAFFSLPIGLLLGCRRRPDVPGGALPRWGVRLAWVAAGWFGVLALQTLFSAISASAWNLVGLVERMLAATEMVAVCLLALWVLRAPAAAAVQPEPAVPPEPAVQP